MDGRNNTVKKLGQTQSVCPECLKVLPADKILAEEGIYLEKTCPEHGLFRTLIWEGDEESYKSWGAKLSPADRISKAKPAQKGCPLDCGLCEAHERKGCCVLLEVTARCNLNCPVCFADAGGGAGEDVPLLELGKQMDYLMEHGGPFNLQISGGEPTMRDDLPELIHMGREKGFTFFQLNTNGIRLAKEEGYAEKLKKAGLSCVYLQFDSVRGDACRILRGQDLREIKEAAIDACGAAGLGVVLVPVIAPGINDNQVGEILKYAVSRMPVVRGVHFQPISYFGRYPEAPESYRMTIPRLLALMEEQTGGMMKAEHFTGGNATNPYCTFQANYLKQDDGSLEALAHGDARSGGVSEQARKFVERQWSGAQPEESENCGCCCGEPEEPQENCCCCGEPEEPQESCCCCGEDTAQLQLDTSSLDAFLARRHNNTFAVSGMLFQDAYNLDLDRLRRCYILETDSRYGMVPFCAYNLTDRKGRFLYR